MTTVDREQRVLLAVLAHPDDESFGMGGTLALYAHRGVEVHLVCATRGEAGEVDPAHLKGYGSIAELREAELRCAAAHLGLSEVHFLGYRDSGMVGSADNQHPQALAAARLDEVATRVAHYIRKLRPQVILTFDPIGGYRHPDHIAIHKATVKAFHLAGDIEHRNGLLPHQPQKLYFHLIPRRFLRLAVFLLRLFGKNPSRWGENADIDLVSIVSQDFPVHAEIDYREVEQRKVAASACHASQGSGGNTRNPILGRVLNTFFGGRDVFMRAYPPPEPGFKKRERDLFSGIF
ncbi:MAG: PIG-L family deacetylase [Chloroflexota bacterium]